MPLAASAGGWLDWLTKLAPIYLENPSWNRAVGPTVLPGPARGAPRKPVHGSVSKEEPISEAPMHRSGRALNNGPHGPRARRRARAPCRL